MRLSVWRPFRCVSAVCILASLPALGCSSSNLGAVQGKVTLDGQPLENAYVSFTPVAGGVPSYGRTDAEGMYELQYSRDQQGAEPGEHVVRVWTRTDGDPDADPPQPAQPEKVPVQFNQESTLRKTVEKGNNQIDLELTSEGQIVQGDLRGE